jgi:hypothetical protein
VAPSAPQHTYQDESQPWYKRAWDYANTPITSSLFGLPEERQGAGGFERGVEHIAAGLTSPLSLALGAATFGTGGWIAGAGETALKESGEFTAAEIADAIKGSKAALQAAKSVPAIEPVIGKALAEAGPELPNLVERAKEVLGPIDRSAEFGEPEVQKALLASGKFSEPELADLTKASQTIRNAKEGFAPIDDAVRASGADVANWKRAQALLSKNGLDETSDLLGGHLLERGAFQIIRKAAPDIPVAGAVRAAKTATEVMQAGFTYQQLEMAAQMSPRFFDALKEGDYDHAMEYGTEAVLSGGMGVLGASHALHTAGELFKPLLGSEETPRLSDRWLAVERANKERETAHAVAEQHGINIQSEAMKRLGHENPNPVFGDKPEIKAQKQADLTDLALWTETHQGDAGKAKAIDSALWKAEGRAPEESPLSGLPQVGTPLASNEVPLQAGTQAVGSTSSGEVRVGADGRPVVWISPADWDIFEAITGQPGTGVNYSPAEADRLLSRFNPESSIGQLISQARKIAGPTAVLKAPGSNPDFTIRVAKEELHHTWQRELATNGEIENHLNRPQWRRLYDIIPPGQTAELDRLGYNQKPIVRVAETAAKFRAGIVPPGVSDEEVLGFLKEYRKEVESKHGKDAWEDPGNINNVAAQHVKDIYDKRRAGQVSANGGLANNAANQGLVGSVGQGGRGAPSLHQEGAVGVRGKTPEGLASRVRKLDEEPLSFASPNVHNLGGIDDAQQRLESRPQKIAEKLSGDLASSLKIKASVRPALGHWEGGAENSVLGRFAPGTDPDAVEYHNALLAKAGYQNAGAGFIPGEGKDVLFQFRVSDGAASTKQIAEVLEQHGIPGDTIEPIPGGNLVHIVGANGEFRPQVSEIAARLGAGKVGEIYGRKFENGDYTDRDAAQSAFDRRLTELEVKHPEWRGVRQAFESRPDHVELSRLVRETKSPFVEGVHGSRTPGISTLTPETDVKGPQKGAQEARAKAFPKDFVKRTYFREEGSHGEPFYEHMPYQYKARMNAENLYDYVDDPDHLLQAAYKEAADRKISGQPGAIGTIYERLMRDSGYEGYYHTGAREIGAFKDTQVEAKLQAQASGRPLSGQLAFGLASGEKPAEWEDIKPHLTPEEVQKHDTPEKQNLLTAAFNSMPNHEEWTAAIRAGRAGSLWYERSTRAFDALIDSGIPWLWKEDKEKFLNFTAALSPVQPVQANLRMALNLWAKWDKAGRPQDVTWKDGKVSSKNASLYRILAGRGDSQGVDLPARMGNAIRALQGEPLSGPKVSSFTKNLGKDASRVTNDTWMAVFGAHDPNRINKPAIYDSMSAKVREAAKAEGVEPRQAQAAIWCFIKSLAELSGWGNDRWIPPQEIIKQGLLTPELVAQHSADFADMLKTDPEIRGVIKKLGGDLNALDTKLETYVPRKPITGEAQEPATHLLNAADRLEASRRDSRVASHLARKQGPSLFDTEFGPDNGLFSRERMPDFIKQAEERGDKDDPLIAGWKKILRGHELSPEEKQEVTNQASKDLSAFIYQPHPNDLDTLWTKQQAKYLSEHPEEAAFRKSVIEKFNPGALAKYGVSPNKPLASRESPDNGLFSKERENTPEFKSFFGDWTKPDKDSVSKVVDQTGQPKVVYHGTKGNFTEFRVDPNNAHSPYGFYFTDSPEYAGKYTANRTGDNIMPAYVRITKPASWEEFKQAIRADRTNGVKNLQAKGYDGVVAKQSEEWGGIPIPNDPNVYVAFSPNQIKSAIGNRGTFDLTNPNMLFSKERENQAPQWYLKSNQLVDSRMQGPMPADTVRKMLENNGVKPDELKYTGLSDFLREKGKEPVRPEEVKDYLAANNLQIQEVTKGQNLSRIDQISQSLYGRPYSSLEETPREVVDRAASRWKGDGEEEQRTKFGTYTLPGGENYRELLLALPDSRETQQLVNRTDQQFRSSHWDEPNVVGHVRFNDRTGPNGEKLLHLEELQSDWHQKGRTLGYRTELLPEEEQRLKHAIEERNLAAEGRANSRRDPDKSAFDEATSRMERLDAEISELNKKKNGPVPDAPFKKTWPELLFKRMTRYASEHGYNGISWTPGEEQAARYDLSKTVDHVEYFPELQRLNATKDGYHVLSESVPKEKLPDYIGKEAARKLLESPLTKKKLEEDFDAHHVLSGTDLKVGGEGMKGFYDKMVPEMANKLGKQFGAKVGETKIEAGTKESRIPIPEEEGGGTQPGRRVADTRTVPYFPITDSMRESVLSQGQPLFSKESPENGQLPPNIDDMIRNNVWKDQPEAYRKQVHDSLGRIASGAVPANVLQAAKYLGPEDARNYEIGSANDILHNHIDDHNHRVWQDANPEGKVISAEARTGKFATNVTAARHRVFDSLVTGLLKSPKQMQFDPVSAVARGRVELIKAAANRQFIRSMRDGFARASDGRPALVLSGSGNVVAGENGEDPKTFISPDRVQKINIAQPAIDEMKKSGDFDRFLADGTIKNLTPRVHPDNIRTSIARMEDQAQRKDAQYNTAPEGPTRPENGQPFAANPAPGEPYNILRQQIAELKHMQESGDYSGLREFNDKMKPVYAWDPQDYITLDHNAMRGWNFVTNDSAGHGILVDAEIKAHPEFAQYLKNRLGLEPSSIANNPIGKAALGVGSAAKHVLLSMSPFHTVQIALRGVLAGVNPFTLHGPDILNGAKIDPADPHSETKIKAMVRQGYTTGTDYKAAQAHSEGLSTGGEALRRIPGVGPLLANSLNAYNDFLFHRYIPAIKATAAEHLFDQYREAHPEWSTDRVAKASALHANNSFGGINWKAMGRSATTQDWGRLMLLAPDWLESEMRSGARLFNKDEGGVSRKQIAIMTMSLWGIARVLNTLATGNPHLEAPFGLATKNKEGKEIIYSIRTLPTDLLHASTDPVGFIKGRLSPTIHTGQELLTQRDTFGRKLGPEDLWADVFHNLSPIPAQAIGQAITGTGPQVGNVGQVWKASGGTAQTYATPAQKMAAELAANHNEDGPVDQALMSRHSRIMSLEDQVRSGEVSWPDLVKLAYNTDQLRETELKKIQANLTKTKGMDSSMASLYTRASRLPAKEYMDLFDTMNPREKTALIPLTQAVMKKYTTKAMKDMTPSERAKDPTLQRILNMMHPSGQPPPSQEQ